MYNMTCNICFEDFEDLENNNQQLFTKCNHLIHKDCLNQIIFPKCPCCKSDITQLLNENGLNNKKIKKNIEAEEFRILVSNVNIDTYNEVEIYNFCVNSKRLNHLKWKNIYKNIILSFIFNAYSTFQNYSETMFNIEKPGIFLYYCDLDNIILNLIYGYRSSIIQWYNQENFKENPNFECFSKGVFNKIKNNYANEFGVLFVIKDIFEDKLYIFNHIFNKDNIIKNYPSNKNIITAISELENVVFDEEDRYNPEKIILESLLKNIDTAIFTYTVKYHSFKIFIQNDIGNYFKKDKIINKNGFIHFKFYNNDDVNSGDEFYYFIENKKKIKYNDLVNSKCININNLDKILMKYLNKYKNGIVRLIIGDNEYTKICAYNVKYYNDECYFKKLDQPIIEQLYNINLSDIEKYKRSVDFKYIYI